MYIIWKNRPRIQILDTHVGIGGSRKEGEPWKFTVSSISVKIKNKGSRSAFKVHGVVSFGKLDALPLYPTEEGNVIFENKFDVAPNEERSLVAAWRYSGSGIDGMKCMSAGEFIEKGPPVRVTIEYTEGKLSKTYDKAFLESYMRKHQERHYLLK